MYEEAKLVAKLFLYRGRDLGIRGSKETAPRYFRGKPVCLCEADGEGDEVLLDLLRGELLADLVQRLDSLAEMSAEYQSR